MLQGHWYMLLLAVGWTTATAYLLVSVVNCYRSYKWSRTLPPVLLRGRENASVWLLSYVSSIGCQSDGGSFSRQQFWHTSVSMVWLHSICNNLQLLTFNHENWLYSINSSNCCSSGESDSGHTSCGGDLQHTPRGDQKWITAVSGSQQLRVVTGYTCLLFV